MSKTYMASKGEIEPNWYVIDAADKVLGRLAVKVGEVLRGKNKPTYTRHTDTGDHVIVINAEKICITGRKATQKLYHHHSGYRGGLKSLTFEKLQEKHPERVIELAIKGMLPKTKLGRAMFKKLKVYAGPEHGHEAQQPLQLEL